MSAIKDELGEMMNQYVAVFRDAEGLQHAHEVIRRLKEEEPKAVIDDRGDLQPGRDRAIELGYMLDCAEATVIGAIERKESRGAQFRTDFPDTQRCRLAQAHRHLGQRRRRAEDQLLGGDDHPVAAAGKDLLQ